MSVLQKETVACPACGNTIETDVFYSVNADRRPDLRAGAIDGSFQTLTCGRCATEFRIDPGFNYLDMARGQWLAAHPAALLGDWAATEALDQAAFDKAYGKDASDGAREIGGSLQVRITFGWPAFREKLVAADAGLDDLELELLKIAILRTQDNAPLSQEIELRFMEENEGGLVLAWLNATTDAVAETLLISRSAYDEIAADKVGWAELRDALSQGPFVDMQRLIV